MNCNKNKLYINNNIEVEVEVEVRKIGNEETKIIIIDGFSRSPNDLIDYVITQGNLACNKRENNFYPGVTCPSEASYTDTLYKVLKPIIKEVYKLPVAYPTRLESTYAMVTFDPSELNQDQRIPHYDSISTGQLAVLHYLCEPPFKGTAFYRHKETGYETITRHRKEHYWSFAEPKLKSSHYGDKYANNGNNEYEKIANVDVKFNRLIIYPSKLLHSSMINPEHLSSDPLKGRLTLRTFITY
jgi:hypothetical protein